ncbi:hypothetical protein BD779DRAFT_1591840, partial [Infundibulicybe gibba]
MVSAGNTLPVRHLTTPYSLRGPTQHLLLLLTNTHHPRPPSCAHAILFASNPCPCLHPTPAHISAFAHYPSLVPRSLACPPPPLCVLWLTTGTG